MAFGEVADVRLVDDRPCPRDLGSSVVAPLEAVVNDNRPWYVGRAVARVLDVWIALKMSIHHMAVDLRAPGDPAVDRPGVRVQQQFGWVVAQAVSRLPGAVRPHPITRPGAQAGHRAEPRSMGAVIQGDPSLAGPALVTGIEEADLYGVCVPGVHGKVHAVAGQCRTERRRQVSSGAHGIKGRQS